MLEHLCQGALAEGDVRLLLAAAGHDGVGVGLATDAVLEHGEAGVDLTGLSHALGAVLGDIAGSFGACKVDEVQHSVFGGGIGRILDAHAADGVGAGRSVILDSFFGLAERRGRLDVAENIRRVGDVMLESTSELDDTEAVLEDGERLAAVQKICIGRDVSAIKPTKVGTNQGYGGATHHRRYFQQARRW